MSLSAEQRETLLLAAKAMGFQNFKVVENKVLPEHTESASFSGLEVQHGGQVFNWNPLDDSADSFNMSVNLGLRWEYRIRAFDKAKLYKIFTPAFDINEYFIGSESDYIVLRRGLTRAAAEIARNLT